jgi:aconitate hydratase
MDATDSTPEFVANAYRSMQDNLANVRKGMGRPMTLAEKVLLSHLDDPTIQDIRPGESYLMLRPDRVAQQDITGQMSILQFMQAGKERVAVPTSVHCDHLIQARVEGKSDTSEAIVENKEVYDFLQSAAGKYGMGFWKPGAGIIHQVVLENYAFPGGLMLGTDSHTPNGGGLGMLAIGVGGADAADVMLGLAWELKYPTLIGVHLTGELSGWAAPKDIILYLAGLLTVSGGTNSIIEYFGPGTRSISCTGKATIANMGAELGATCSVFPFDERMDTYLRATRRAALADLAQANVDLLRADQEVESHPEQYFKRVVEIDLSKLEPQVVGPYTPDLARPISALADEVNEKGYADQISDSLIGSCTNSSYEDMCRAADVAEQARAHGIDASVPLLVTPGSEQIRATIERDGQMASLSAIGGRVLANACGPCIGQWRREGVAEGQPNTIITSFNRNFARRNDGRAETANFIASPEIVIAFALAGRLSFNPLVDTLTASDGSTFKLDAPGPAPDVPSEGFATNQEMYISPAEDGDMVEVVISPDSNRLEVLEPFSEWDGKDFLEVPVLLKAKGKCTTDHISPAGPWLRFRGHLSNLSDNTYLGAVNSYTDEPGKGLNQLTSEGGQPFPEIAKDYKSRGLRWVAIGDENYGEGSSREHAAMSPRLLGAAAVIVRSFARIAETNLKKQGLLALTFGNPADYDRIQETDRVSLIGLENLAAGKPITCHLHHADGSQESIQLQHTFNEAQAGWFKAGAALNLLRQGGS